MRRHAMWIHPRQSGTGKELEQMIRAYKRSPSRMRIYVIKLSVDLKEELSCSRESVNLKRPTRLKELRENRMFENIIEMNLRQSPGILDQSE